MSQSTPVRPYPDVGLYDPLCKAIFFPSPSEMSLFLLFMQGLATSIAPHLLLFKRGEPSSTPNKASAGLGSDLRYLSSRLDILWRSPVERVHELWVIPC
jgi:hypothetical protein